MVNHKHKVSSVMMVAAVVVVLVTQNVWQILQNLFIKNWKYCTFSKHVKVKVKQSRYRPGVAQRVPGS